MSNTAFLIDTCVSLLKGNGSKRCLDYGCGAAEVTAGGLERGLDFYGTDLFYAGGDHRDEVPPHLIAERRVVTLVDGKKIPWPDAHFDLVSCNQVIEHVQDLDSVVQELDRVVKPGGQMLVIFPHLETWLEVHSGLPFIHWMSKGNPLRVPYAWFLRLFGLGFYKMGKPRGVWARDASRWIADWTHYRAKSAIFKAFGRCFCDIQHRDIEFFDYRMKHRPLVVRSLPRLVKQFIVRKYAGMILTMRKPDQP